MTRATGATALAVVGESRQARRKGWDAERAEAELDGIVPLQQASEVLKIGRDKGYRLARSGEFPVPVDRHGRSYVVLKVDLVALLRGELRRS